MTGRRFVVFLSADAGIARLVAVLHGDSPETATGYSLVTPAEGSEFTEASPRLHYGWETTREYRTQFGHLDYSCWQNADGSYGRDVGPPVRLPAGLVDRCEFVLFPYVCHKFTDAILWEGHAESLTELRSGAAHPARDEVLELARQAELLGPAWNALSEPERDWVLSHEMDGPPPAGEPSAEVRSYLLIADSIDIIASSLREAEANKIRAALAALDDYLQEDRTL